MIEQGLKSGMIKIQVSNLIIYPILGTDKHNYATAFYWTLLSHIDAYRIANTNVLQSNKNHAEDPKEKLFVEHVKAGVDAA